MRLSIVIRTLVIVCLLVFVGLCRTLSAKAAWIHLGPTNGLSSALAIDHQDGRMLYYAFSGYEWTSLYKSIDGGVNWELLNPQGLPTPQDICCLLLDPSNATTLYAICAIGHLTDGLYKSTDGGLNWHNIFLSYNSISDFTINPIHTNILYIGTQHDMYMSTDGGNSWHDAFSSGTPEDLITVDPTNTLNIYFILRQQMIGDFGGVWKTSDGGKTWKNANKGLPNGQYCAYLTIDPQHTDILYVVIQDISSQNTASVYKSTNSGATWSQVSSLNVGAWFSVQLAIDPIHTNTIYAGTWDGAYKSTDSGETWQQMNGGLTDTNVHLLTIDPHNPQFVYVGTNAQGLFKYIPDSSWVELLLSD